MSSCLSAQDPQLVRLADAIAQRVGQQRFSVWFSNSTRLDLRQDGLEIAVPNDFISEWISKNFAQPIQDAAHEVLGTPLALRFHVVPELFEVDGGADDGAAGDGSRGDGPRGEAAAETRRAAGQPAPAGRLGRPGRPGVGSVTRDADGSVTAASRPLAELSGRGLPAPRLGGASHAGGSPSSASVALMTSPGLGGTAAASAPLPRPKLRHDLASFVVGPSNHLAHNAATYVAEFPGSQYNPLFIHGGCGLGKTHLLQGICRKFIEHHPAKRWAYLTGEEFTNDYITHLRANKVDVFRRRMRDLDLLVIDDVHFLAGKKATLEEFLHTFNAIEAMGKQVVLASDEHPKLIAEFGESLVNRFVSGMVVRIDPPNHQTRCELLKVLALRAGQPLGDDVIQWVARRVTQNVRELEGAVTRITAHVRLTGRPADVATAQSALGDLDRQMGAPVRPENVMQAVCAYFGLEHKDLMSGRRQRTISLARSTAMYLIRKTAKLSFPEIGTRMGKRNHSTVISACRRIERAAEGNETLAWTSSVGEREEEAQELLQRLEEHARAMG
jgi:chromosomal replication initiator protein